MKLNCKEEKLTKMTFIWIVFNGNKYFNIRYIKYLSTFLILNYISSLKIS